MPLLKFNKSGSVIELNLPEDLEKFKMLRAGDHVLFSGEVLCARDQAHRRLCDLIRKGSKLPVEIKDSVIYYCGPTQTPPGRVIGSCGPTTSSRMDALTLPLLEVGLKGMIGKGRRSPEVRRALRRFGAVYFLATGGAGALLSQRVVANELVCFAELGPEAVRRLTLKDFPLVVGIDVKGNDIFERINK